MGGDSFGVHAAKVAHAAAGVFAGVAVEHFAPVTAVGDADAISETGHRSEVADDEYGVARRLAFAQEGNCAGEAVVAVDPLDPGGIIVEDVHSGFVPIEPVKLLHP